MITLDKTPTDHDETPLYHAVMRDDRQLIDELIGDGAHPDVGVPGMAGPIHLLSMIQDEAVELLLQRGADPNLRTHEGVVPLDIAASQGRVQLIETLLDHGADPYLEADQGRPIDREAVRRCVEGRAARGRAQGETPPVGPSSL